VRVPALSSLALYVFVGVFMGSMVLPSQAYEVKLAPHPAPFSVFRFEGEEAVIRAGC
jgi:hypothetical protein